MTPQMKAFCAFLVAGGLVGGFFLWVALSTRHVRDVDTKTAHRLRRRYFYVLSSVLLIIFALTIPRMPHPVSDQRPDRVVFVVGKQFAFGISDQPITNEEEYEAAASSAPIEVKVGELVEFRVSSVDVNHGFSAYSPSGALVAQVQAIPGYVNRLRVRFDEPGTYNVFCLQLCGMSHHLMHSVFYVVPQQGAATRASPGGRGTGD